MSARPTSGALMASLPGVTPAYRDRYPGRTKLARRRQELDLSQEDLARTVGVSLSSLRRLEAGTEPTNPGIVTVIALATALRCEIRELLEERWYKAAFEQGAWSRDPELYAELRQRRSQRGARPPSQI
jgi:transcriptional regulator with XRE-family HTH domain